MRLYKKSVLKQRKYQEVNAMLGETDRLRCLDIGADNGVISYLLRNGKASWASADLNETAVNAIRELVHDEVFQIDGGRTPFADDEFDRVVILDFLEHIPDDRKFVEELYRIIKPGGELVMNVPHIKNSLLRKFRLAIGQTDEKHGHLRPGYTVDGLNSLCSGKFTVLSHKSYSKFFSEAIDTLITFGFSFLKKEERSSQKGLIVTGEDLNKYQKLFLAYSIVYPVVWIFGQMDKLLFWRSGYMLIARARINK